VKLAKWFPVATAAGALLLTAACSSDDDANTGDQSTSGADGGSDASHRGGTFTMLWSSAGSSIDPATDYDPNWFILRMTHDGLMAWKQVGGAEGNELVPDLASEIPTPTDGDTTYEFTLRDGITFSNGDPLKASDIAYSLTRQFKIPGPGVGMYAALEGGDACISDPGSCDLAKGVVTDDDAGTVTFHLSRPDPDFLQKLALPFAYVVPSGTPNKETGTTPIPGTGPYVIENYSPGKEMALQRNSEFEEWSADAQPDGYPDEIVMKIGLTAEDAVTEVTNGTADWVYDAPPADRLGELATEYPDQIHIDTTTIQYYMALNTRVAPFDNPDVRRALNFATDREALVGLFGGDRLATPSCQILPANFPAYEAYCPYTADPGTEWTAPDMEKAQELVDASGTKGQEVVVVGSPDETTKAIDLYFVSLLNDLGYDASLKTLNGAVAYSYVQDSRNKAQISYTYWAPDFTAPSNFLAISVGCDGFREASTASPNLSEFCDPDIDALTKQAAETQVDDPDAANALWTQIDHMVTDAAPQVTLFTGNKLNFVSARVGNYQYSPAVTGNFLIDQAWVQ
jgi:peptide/nickel transport system substrate-binding protein